MSIVNSPTRPSRDRFSSPIINDVNNDAERQLCNAVDAMLTGVTRVLQQSANEKSAKLKLQGATTSFLRANGIRVAQENIDDVTPTRPTITSSRAAGGESQISSTAETLLRTQLEQCRDLLRKVDGERRYLRKHCVHLQAEQDQRRTEAEALHRYTTESHQRSLALEHQAAEERQRRRGLEETLDAQTLELMQLRRVLRALPGDVVASLNTPATSPSASSSALSAEAAQPLVPDRRFEEAFKDKMAGIVYKRRYRQAKKMHQAASEQLEALRMEQHDPQRVVPQWALLDTAAIPGERRVSALTPLVGSGDTEEESAAAVRAGVLGGSEDAHHDVSAAASSTVAALASAVFWQSAVDFPFQLPFTTATPQDALVKSLLYRSQYAEPLTQLREHTLRLSSRLKTTQDAGLRSLYLTFHQALQRIGANSAAQAQCRSLYERQMDKMQRAHRDLLYSLIEQVNHAAVEIPEMERAGSFGRARQGSRSSFGGPSAVPRRDVGCSAMESVSVEEFHTAQLKEQLSRLKLQSLEAAAAALKDKEEAASQYSTVRHEALQALQSLKKLTTGIVASVQAQQEATEVVYDPLSQLPDALTEGVLDDPRLVTKVAEATDLTLTYVRQLARRGAASATTAATSAHLSAAALADSAGDDDGAYGRIIDIHRRSQDAFSAGPSPQAALGAEGKAKRRASNRGRGAQGDRRASAPASLSNTMRQPASRSASTARRRQTLPQLPAAVAALGVRKTPTAPNTQRGLRGRPATGGGGAAAVLSTPPLEGTRQPAHGNAFKAADAVKESKESPAKAGGRSPNAAISVIELGFDEETVR